MKKITMVVPIYNDLESLIELLRQIELQASDKIHYLIVNNGSNLRGIAEELEVRSNYWTALQLESNKGFGGGILEGIKMAPTEWIGWMPGNLKILPKDVESLVLGLDLKENSFIKCHRLRNSKIARIKTFVAGLIQTFLTGKNLFDTGGTPTICKKEFVLSLRELPTDYVIESRMLFEARRYSLSVERPRIPYGERLFGHSHWQRGLRSEAKLMKSIIQDAIQSKKRNN